MPRIVPALNSLATSALVVVLWYSAARDRIAFPILLYFVVVGVPATSALLSSAIRSRTIRHVSVGMHIIGLAILGVMYVLAWIVSPGSGVAATLPLGVAAAINYLSFMDLRSSSPDRMVCRG